MSVDEVMVLRRRGNEFAATLRLLNGDHRVKCGPLEFGLSLWRSMVTGRQYACYQNEWGDYWYVVQESGCPGDGLLSYRFVEVDDVWALEYGEAEALRLELEAEGDSDGR